MGVKLYSGNDWLFLKACKLAKATPTHRQWKKWGRSEGAAFAKRVLAKRLNEMEAELNRLAADDSAEAADKKASLMLVISQMGG